MVLVMVRKGLTNAVQKAAVMAAIQKDAWNTLCGANLDWQDPDVSGNDLLSMIQKYFYTPANRNKHKVSLGLAASMLIITAEAE